MKGLRRWKPAAVFFALCLCSVTEPFWLVNGDIFCVYDYRERGLTDGMLGHLVMVPNPRHNREGDFSLDERQGDCTRAPQSLTYSGISVLHPALFNGCSDGKFPLAPLLDNAIKQDALSGELLRRTLGTDVGTPERLAELDRLLST